jgi:hypothetical protein
MEWKFEEQFMMDQWDKWTRWILERRGSLPRDCFENFLGEVIDLKAKHDELAELAAWYFEATYLVLPKPPICLPVKQRSKIHLNAFWEIVDIIAEAEAALHKAVGREG